MLLAKHSASACLKAAGFSSRGCPTPLPPPGHHSRSRTRARASGGEQAARCDLAAAYHLAHRFGFSDVVWNHLTLRVPGQRQRFLTHQFGLHFLEVTASNLLKVDEQGVVVEGELAGEEVASFHMLHGVAHGCSQYATCVMHAHPPYTTAVGATAEGLLPLTMDAMFLSDLVGYVPFDGVPLEEALPAALRGRRQVAVLRNHGVLTLGRSVGEAFVLMTQMEKACRMQAIAQSTGAELLLPEPELVAEAAADFMGDSDIPGTYEWPALIRQLEWESGDMYRS